MMDINCKTVLIALLSFTLTASKGQTFEKKYSNDPFEFISGIESESSIGGYLYTTQVGKLHLINSSGIPVWSRQIPGLTNTLNASLAKWIGSSSTIVETGNLDYILGGSTELGVIDIVDDLGTIAWTNISPSGAVNYTKYLRFQPTIDYPQGKLVRGQIMDVSKKGTGFVASGFHVFDLIGSPGYLGYAPIIFESDANGSVLWMSALNSFNVTGIPPFYNDACKIEASKDGYHYIVQGKYYGPSTPISTGTEGRFYMVKVVPGGITNIW